MAPLWQSPVYKLKTPSGKEITIDVTTSISGGLAPSRVVTDVIVPLFLARGVHRIVDFGAGALRYTLPLLAAGFDVYAVEFQRAFQRDAAAHALAQARQFPNFYELVWPHEFLSNNVRFDAALLCYVIQTMPLPEERKKVINALKKKLKVESYLLYMARYNQVGGKISGKQRVSDGYFMWPKREEHSFYREFGTPETHQYYKSFGFHHIRSLSERGTDQMFLYGRGPAGFV